VRYLQAPQPNDLSTVPYDEGYALYRQPKTQHGDTYEEKDRHMDTLVNIGYRVSYVIVVDVVKPIYLY
jgi:hypothetical protein